MISTVDEVVIIDVENLVKKFEDVVALKRISFKVFKGEVFGFLGPNGAGKTTTVNILTGLLKPTSGKVLVLGHEATKDISRIEWFIGVCPQETAVFNHLTGWENIEFFANLYLLDKNIVKERSRMLIEKMGLSTDIKRKVGKYSGGMKRRLSLILSLIHDPEVLFLDEPTVGMDPQSRRAVWDLINELKKLGKTVFLTTHYMEEAEELCDRLAIIDHGKIIALGTPKELISKYNVKNLEDVFIALTGRKIREGM